jgi:pimeloyl-ACP methyl ester carboxylesterase
MYYEIHGTGGTPLVLLHGGGSTIETTFGHILPMLAKKRQVIAFEQQGHGRTTDIADRPFTFVQSADDAAALLRHLKIDKADFFGFSNGGSIAVQIAIRHPKIVRKLVLVSALIGRDGADPQFWESMKAPTLESMPADLRDAYVKVAPHPEQLQSFFDKSVKRMQDFKDMPHADIRAIKAPALIVIGDQDVIRPEHAVDMYRLLTAARLAILPAGHGTFMEAGGGSTLPSLTVSMVEEFLDAK